MPAATSIHHGPPPVRGIGGVVALRGVAMAVLIMGLFASGLARADLSGFLAPKKSMEADGGAEFSLRLQARESDDGSEIPILKPQIDQTLSILKKRLKAIGFRDAKVSPQGENGILVQVPGAAAAESKRLKAMLANIGKLELREVSPRNDEIAINGETLAARVAAGAEIVPGYKAYIQKRKDADGTEISKPILLHRRVAIGSADIASALPFPPQPDAISITLNKVGKDKMIALTKDMVPGKGRIAIVLNGVVISAPVVNMVPLGKNFIIEGLNEPGEVESVASALMNPLENALVIEEERTIPPPEKSK